MTKLIGTGPNQIPVNALLGDMAFQSKDGIMVDKIVIGSTANNSVNTSTSLDMSTKTDGICFPVGTTAQRPANAKVGTVRYNSETGVLENYTTQGWTKVSSTPPIITQVTGTLYSGNTSTLTITGANFGTTPGTLVFTSGATTNTSTQTSLTGSSLTVSVPADIYNLSAGSSVNITFTNSDGLTSGIYTTTLVALPTGGNISYSGGYRYHTFTSGGTFATFSSAITIDYLIVAGGGGASCGGGGAGGYRSFTGASIPINSSLSVVVGAGGTGSASVTASAGTDGGSSSFNGNSCVGGGGGGSSGVLGGSLPTGRAGGSGGGGGTYGTNTGGAGTSGQGSAGGRGYQNTNDNSGGGGGAAAVGSNATTNVVGGNGGAGLQWLNGTYYAGGGGGSTQGSSTGPATGGNGGGGSGNIAGNNSSRTDGTANRGGGGGGSNASGGNGGSGVVIIRYAFTS